MPPTPRKSPASSAKRKRTSLAGTSTAASSPRASTSRATLDSPMPSSAAKGKKDRTSLAPSKPAHEDDDRFKAFLDQAGDDDQDEEIDAANGGDDEVAELGAVDLEEDAQDGLPDEDEDDRFAAFPAEDDLEADDVELSEADLLARTTLPAHLLPRSLAAAKDGKGKKIKTPGLVYLSRIPPGMGPGKVKHLLGQFGEVGRIYLARADAGKEISAAKRAKQRERHQSHNFKEGWVEFLDKRVARSVAEMLNAQTIGGKKSERWHDDIWTMRYLPRFRWDQLSEQVALERATRTSLLRFHLTHSKAEQESYLSAVERARTNSKIEEKAASRGKAPKGTKRKADGGEGEREKKKREFRQRERVDTSEKLRKGGSGGGGDVQLESVLGRLF
ncbi:hypothetical protein JCM8097_006573 [Rhodosporidiobolus ruineniae]